MSKIEWTERTWNPVVGCTKISQGCKNCYAENMAHRLQKIGLRGYENGFKLKILPERLVEPQARKKPTVYFVCSMSDLFHEDVPFNYIDQVFDSIEKSSWHTFQILTKRVERMAEYFKDKSVPKNVWLGVSVENKASVYRIDCLKEINTDIRFLSVEPLLEDLGVIDLHGIEWVIVGGESGSKARQMKKEWVKNIQKCASYCETKFFFKQWGAYGEDGVRRNKKANGRTIDGSLFNESPYIERKTYE